MKHEHKEIKDCEHKKIEHCKKCDVVECLECGKEWKVTAPNSNWADGTRIIPNNPYGGVMPLCNQNHLGSYCNMCNTPYEGYHKCPDGTFSEPK